MNIFRITTLLVSTIPLTWAAADAPSLNGDWQVEIEIANRQSTSTCTFAQTGNELGGTCTSPSGPAKVKGKVDGSKVTWSINTEGEAGPVTVLYEGKIDSESRMSGMVTAVEFSVSGDFKATRTNSKS